VIAKKATRRQSARMAAPKRNHIPRDMADAMRPERIGERLRLIRIAYGLKPSEIADDLGIERTYWSRFEGGKRAITDSVSVALVARFAVTLDFIVLGRWEKLPIDVADKLRAVEGK